MSINTAEPSFEHQRRSETDLIIDSMIQAVLRLGTDACWVDSATLPEFDRVRTLSEEQALEIACRAIPRLVEQHAAYYRANGSYYATTKVSQARAEIQATSDMIRWYVLSRKSLTTAQADVLCAALLDTDRSSLFISRLDWEVCRRLEPHADRLTDHMRRWLEQTLSGWKRSYQKPDPARVRLVRRMLGASLAIEIEPGEPWANQALQDMSVNDRGDLPSWKSLILLCAESRSASPTAKWTKQADVLLNAIGHDAFARRLCAWFPLVDKPRSAMAHEGEDQRHFEPLQLIDANADVLKGLCWAAARVRNDNLTRALGRLAISAYRKIPGIGPRAVRVGNAAVYALGEIPGETALGQLAILCVKVKFGTAQKLIAKALRTAAERTGVPASEIHELAVPEYGLTAVGRRTDVIAGHTVSIVLNASGKAEIRYARADGKPAKAAPKALKVSCADELRELKAVSKDIAAMIVAQRERIDGLFLENRTWQFRDWRKRYLDHPLVGVIARKLIWTLIEADRPSCSAIWLNNPAEQGSSGLEGGALTTVDGRRAPLDEARTTVRLWHPVEASTDEVLAWRRFVEDREIRQPFKQAHREVYILTDAERRTNTYSNRFASHVLRQHQFHALAAARNWKNKLRLLVDAEYPPTTRELAPWELRAEYWVDGVSDGEGGDVADSGAFLYLTTDQVRFYRADALANSAHAGGGGYAMRGAPEAGNDPVPLDQIPALVLSEVLRDVDLFVGVASIGNNPQWQDGGPEGRYREYWWSYGFGDLAESGRSRRDVLSRLVPRLKIADRCSLQDRYLVVKGSLRTYKIHLGSGNILMTPNDQYLCIVPDGHSLLEDTSGKPTFLPFEGDRTLAIILSKAFMLADDANITDASIRSQIKGG